MRGRAAVVGQDDRRLDLRSPAARSRCLCARRSCGAPRTPVQNARRFRTRAGAPAPSRAGSHSNVRGGRRRASRPRAARRRRIGTQRDRFARVDRGRAQSAADPYGVRGSGFRRCVEAPRTGMRFSPELDAGGDVLSGRRTGVVRRECHTDAPARPHVGCRLRGQARALVGEVGNRRDRQRRRVECERGRLLRRDLSLRDDLRAVEAARRYARDTRPSPTHWPGANARRSVRTRCRTTNPARVRSSRPLTRAEPATYAVCSGTGATTTTSCALDSPAL